MENFKNDCSNKIIAEYMGVEYNEKTTKEDYDKALKLIHDYEKDMDNLSIIPLYVLCHMDSGFCFATTNKDYSDRESKKGYSVNIIELVNPK